MNAQWFVLFFLVLILGIVVTYFDFVAPARYCHFIGMGGISHVPANCIKYFVK